MQFIKTAFWVIVAVAIALFSKANWVLAPSYTGYVPVKLWGDIIVETRLPVLIIAAFLLGLLPMWIFAKATRWRMGRKLESAERALASTMPPPAAPPVSAAAMPDASAPLPSPFEGKS